MVSEEKGTWISVIHKPSSIGSLPFQQNFPNYILQFCSPVGFAKPGFTKLQEALIVIHHWIMQQLLKFHIVLAIVWRYDAVPKQEVDNHSCAIRLEIIATDKFDYLNNKKGNDD